MKKLLLILLCLPMIGFGQEVGWQEEKYGTHQKYDYCKYLSINSFHNKNIFSIAVNRRNELYVEMELLEISQLKGKVERFIKNNGINPSLSDNSKSAFFLIRSDGFKTLDYEIIGTINSVYSMLNIPINERKICYMRMGSPEMEEYTKNLLPPPPPTY